MTVQDVIQLQPEALDIERVLANQEVRELLNGLFHDEIAAAVGQPAVETVFLVVRFA